MLFFAEKSFADIATDAAEVPSFNYWSEFINMLLTLFFIIGLIIVSVWALKKIMRSRVQHLNRATGIKILERRVLNPKASLYIVDILGKAVVISESSAGIQLITEFSADVDVNQLLDQAQDQVDNRISMREKLSSKFKKLVSKT